MENDLETIKEICLSISDKPTFKEGFESMGPTHLKKFLKAASQNRVLYAFSKNIKNHFDEYPNKNNIYFEIDKILNHAESEYIDKQKKTFILLNDTLSDIDFLVVKTYKYIPYVTYDVDLFINQKDLENIAPILISKGGKIKEHEVALKTTTSQFNYYNKNCLTIDIHTSFTKQGQSYIDTEVVINSIRTVEFLNTSIKIPNIESEILLNAANLLFERRYVTLLDIVFFNSAFNEKINWEIINKQLRKHNWENSFTGLMIIINHFLSNLYSDFNQESFDEFFKFNEKKSLIKLNRSDSLPYMFPFKFVVNTFKERHKNPINIPKFDLFYYLFTLTRYYYSKKERFPFYTEWHDI